MLQIKYKTIPRELGVVYVFGVWAGGIIACYREIMYASGSNTRVSNHKIRTDRGTTRRYIIIEHKKKDMKIYFAEIKRHSWKPMTIGSASSDTGIHQNNLRNVLKKVQALAESYPNHAMLTKLVPKRNKKVSRGGRRDAKKKS